MVTETDGDRLMEYLKYQGRNKQWLAKLLGMDPSQITKAINGDLHREFTATQRELIGRSLGVPPARIFEGHVS